MTQKIAVAIIHGVGAQNAKFAEPMADEITERFAKQLPKTVENPKGELVIVPIHWAPVLQTAQTRLWRKVNQNSNLDWTRLRRFMIDFVGDAIAYQPSPREKTKYDAIHARVAKSLNTLANDAGPKAPLCVIAHSLGTVVASNYFYDLSMPRSCKLLSKAVTKEMGQSALEKGHTLTWFHTLGSPLALWSLRYANFGTPITVPSTKLVKHHPTIKGGWINFYDNDDVIAYPLKSINDAHRKAIKEDREINVGGILSSWNPMSHNQYWTDNDVTKPIAKNLANTWKAINN